MGEEGDAERKADKTAADARVLGRDSRNDCSIE
jgi:hypothetical protein